MPAVLALPLHTDLPVCILITHSSISASQILLQTSVLPLCSERLSCNGTDTNSCWIPGPGQCLQTGDDNCLHQRAVVYRHTRKILFWPYLLSAFLVYSFWSNAESGPLFLLFLSCDLGWDNFFRALAINQTTHAAKHTLLACRKYPWNARYPWRIRWFRETLTVRKESTCSSVHLLHAGRQTSPAVSLLGCITDRRVLHEGRKIPPRPFAFCCIFYTAPAATGMLGGTRLPVHVSVNYIKGIGLRDFAALCQAISFLLELSGEYICTVQPNGISTVSVRVWDNKQAVDRQDPSHGCMLLRTSFSLLGSWYTSYVSRQEHRTYSYILPCLITAPHSIPCPQTAAIICLLL